jgi:predicted acetyltransferase
MFGFGFGFREVDEVRENRPANKTFYDKINKEVENVKNKMTDEEWEKLLQDLDKPLFKR